MDEPATDSATPSTDDVETPRNAAEAERRDNEAMANWMRESGSVTEEENESWRSHWTPHGDEMLMHGGCGASCEV